MAALDDLFGEYRAAYREGDLDPNPFLERASGADRARLAAMIDAFLVRAPRRAVESTSLSDSAAGAAVEHAHRSLTRVGGTWPSLLPSLRNRIKLQRSELVRQLAVRLGAQSKEEKVGLYYHQMEQGLLPAAGVSEKVLEALGAIVGVPASSIREAGAMSSPAPASQPAGEVFARARSGEPSADESPAQGDEPDEVDRLFLGG
jgi:hypothetical protein